MNKALLSVLILFLSFHLVSAFDVLDVDGNQREYFSVSEPDVKVVSDVFLSNLTINFTSLGNNYSEILNFSDCSDNYCAEFSLVDLVSGVGGSFGSSNEFEVIVGGVSKVIYLDFQSPIFEILNSSIDADSKTLNIEFNYSDNYGVDIIKIYKEDSNGETLLDETSGGEDFLYALTDNENLVLIFRIFDFAGNVKKVQEVFPIEDIFDPQFEYYVIEDKGNEMSVEFEISDNYDLEKYVISQDNFFISEIIEGKSFKSIVDVPFTQGVVLIEVFDSSGNKISKEINLNSNIKVTFPDEIYSNKKKFVFDSNAASCFLSKVGYVNFDEKFDENNNEFSVNLAISNVGKYVVEFFCEIEGYREYFSRDFYYDVNEPDSTTISVQSTDYGSIEISWTEARDEEGDVKYYLYRNDEQIYKGSKLSYEDSGVSYPEKYAYYVRVYDEAGNNVKSNEVSTVPVKQGINFVATTPKEETTKIETYTVSFNTDVNSDVTIKVRNKGVLVDEKSLQDIAKGSVVSKVTLADGVNEIVVSVVDDFGNSYEESFFVTYAAPVIEEPIVEEVVQEPISEPEQVVEEVAEEENSFSWLWIILLIVILGTVVWYFVSKDSDVNKKVKKIKNKKQLEFHKKRRDDVILGKSLEKTKKERIKKQLDAQREKERQEKKRELTEFEKQKMKDLGIRRDISIPFEVREKQKKRVDKIKKDVVEKPEHTLEKRVAEDISEKKTSLFATAFGRKKDEGKKDEFMDYLMSRKSAAEWDSTLAYVQKQRPMVEEESFVVPEKKEVLPKEEVNVEEPVVEEKPVKKEIKERINLDDYLNRRTKKKRFYFAERDVDRDLRNRR